MVQALALPALLAASLLATALPAAELLVPGRGALVPFIPRNCCPPLYCPPELLPGAVLLPSTLLSSELLHTTIQATPLHHAALQSSLHPKHYGRLMLGREHTPVSRTVRV